MVREKYLRITRKEVKSSKAIGRGRSSTSDESSIEVMSLQKIAYYCFIHLFKRILTCLGLGARRKVSRRVKFAKRSL